MVLGIEPRALHILGKCCPTTLQPSQFWFYLVLFYFETDSQQVAQARLELSWLCLLSVGIKGVSCRTWHPQSLRIGSFLPPSLPPSLPLFACANCAGSPFNTSQIVRKTKRKFCQTRCFLVSGGLPKLADFRPSEEDSVFCHVKTVNNKSAERL